MSQALYRKYRPKKLAEVAGQDHIIRTLDTALKTGAISHAYLFTGPKGVGKTSVARILAHEINGLKYSSDSPHIDIIEIDAASNRRIDEIRELRELVYMAPVQAKYKVYIIDEVHMLTKEAFNALLKTLEEPPQHVIFILATTDAHKLPETIISRTQRYSFKPINDSAVTSQLKTIAKKEKIEIKTEALDLIAEHSSGSLRDSVSLLDQARSHAKTVTADTITDLLGLPPRDILDAIVKLIDQGGQAKPLIDKLNQLYDYGYQPSLIAKELSTILRQRFLNDELSDKIKTLDLLGELLLTQSSLDPKIHLELALLKSLPSEAVSAKPAEVKAIITEEVKVEIPKSSSKVDIDSSLWPEILSALKSKHNTLYSIVRMAEPEFSGKKLILAFEFEFHVKRLGEANNQKLLNDVIKEITGNEIKLELKNKAGLSKKSDKDNINKVSAIFNGAELLES